MAKAGKRSNDEAGYDSTRAKRSKWRKWNRQPSQIGDGPDSEDLEHSSVKFITAPKEPANRSHAVVAKLRNTVEEGKQRLCNSLEGKVLGVIKQEHEYKESFIKATLDIQGEQTKLDEKEVEDLSISKPTASVIYHRAKSNIATSRELLGHYERASQRVALFEKVLIMDSGWQKDCQTLERILGSRREKTKLQVHQFLADDPESPKEQIDRDLSTLDTNLWNHFAVGEAKKESVESLNKGKGGTWAVIAKNAQRGVRRAVKNLPEDDE